MEAAVGTTEIPAIEICAVDDCIMVGRIRVAETETAVMAAASLLLIEMESFCLFPEWEYMGDFGIGVPHVVVSHIDGKGGGEV
jgi:hypothetical protein